MHGSKHEFFWDVVDSLEKIPNKDFGIFSLQDRSVNVTTTLYTRQVRLRRTAGKWPKPDIA